MKTRYTSVAVVAAIVLVAIFAYQFGVSRSSVVTVTQSIPSADSPNISSDRAVALGRVVVVGSDAEVLAVFNDIGLSYLSGNDPVYREAMQNPPSVWLVTHPWILSEYPRRFKGIAYFDDDVLKITVGISTPVTTTVTKTVDTAEARVRDFIFYMRRGPPYNYPHLERNLAWSDMSPWGIRSLKIEELRLSQDNKIIEVYNVVYVDLNENTYRYDALAIER